MIAAAAGRPRVERKAVCSWCAEQGKQIPAFVLNRPQFRDAKFLLTGVNVGCGSSREAAVHALVAFGIRCVIAPSFGDIFYSNCFKNGVLPIIRSEAEVLALAREAEPGGSAAVFTADLLASTLVTPSGRTIRIELAAFRRQQLLEDSTKSCSHCVVQRRFQRTIGLPQSCGLGPTA